MMNSSLDVDLDLSSLALLLNASENNLINNIWSSGLYSTTSTNSQSPLPSNMKDLMSREGTGLTPTPTNENCNNQRIPETIIATPKARLNQPVSLTSTPAQESPLAMFQEVQTPANDTIGFMLQAQTPSNDTSGFSTGNSDWSSSNASATNQHFQNIHSRHSPVANNTNVSQSSIIEELLETSYRSKEDKMMSSSYLPVVSSDNDLQSNVMSGLPNSVLTDATRSQADISSTNATSNYSILDTYLNSSTTSAQMGESAVFIPPIIDAPTLAILQNAAVSLSSQQMYALAANSNDLASLVAASKPSFYNNPVSASLQQNTVAVANYLRQLNELNEAFQNVILRQQQQDQTYLNLFNNNSDLGALVAQMQKRHSDYFQTPSLTSIGAFNNASAAYNTSSSGAVRSTTMDKASMNERSPSVATHQAWLEQLQLYNDSLKTDSSNLNLFNVREIEAAAAHYRNSATVIAQNKEPTLIWSGKLPNRSLLTGLLSRKIFLGGVPWDSTAEDLQNIFSQFGNVSVLWPQKENFLNTGHAPPTKGYCYLVYNDDQPVRHLISKCTIDHNGSNYFKISSPKFRTKDVQVIPWVVGDSQYSRSPLQTLTTKMTIFVGALHGMITAEALYNIINDMFGGVTSASLDMDKYKYPIGSGRVTFSNPSSYIRAVTANFIDIRTQRFNKTIQIDPYLEDAKCALCPLGGIYFCRAFECFAYFCPNCWSSYHNTNETLVGHKPLRRTFKPPSS